MVKTKYKTTEDMNNEFQKIDGKSNLKFHENIGCYCDRIICVRQSNPFRFEEDPFGFNAQSIAFIMH